MASKCSQKHIAVPDYQDFNDYDLYDKATAQYAKDIHINKYYTELVRQYAKTSFYRQAFNSCAYLKDYVKGK